ncbi:YicC family protein [Hydrogenobaculum acidophilum]
MANSLARSMTGFAHKSFDVDGFSIVISIKSLNGKGLDIVVKIPSPELQFLEPYIKDYIRSYISRGTVLINIDVKQRSDIEHINVELLKNIITDVKNTCIALNINISEDKVFDIAMENYKASQEKKEQDKDYIMKLFEETFEELMFSKEKEGAFLIKDIKSRVELLEKYLQQAKDMFKEYENLMKEKLLEKAKAFNLEEQNPIVINELMFLLQRLDISEELSRIENHLNHMLEILNSSNVEKGKKMEFVAQELHREITTMSNKVPELSRIAVNMKYETDKIKQQSANLE